MDLRETTILIATVMKAAAGQEVQPGIQLFEIYPGYVLPGENGAQQSVNLEGDRRRVAEKPEATSYSQPTAAPLVSAVRYPTQAATGPAAYLSAAVNTLSGAFLPGNLRRGLSFLQTS